MTTRSNERLPTVEPHPAGDDFAFVSRVERRPQAESRCDVIGGKRGNQTTNHSRHHEHDNL